MAEVGAPRSRGSLGLGWDKIRVTVPVHSRLVGVVLLATAAALSPLLPPAHIHLVIADHDHVHAVAVEHAHWSAHGASRAAFDDDDGRAIFVDHPVLTSSVNMTFARPAFAVVALLTLPAPRATFTAVDRQTSGNSPRDGPSRGIGQLRAPPLVL